MIEDDATRLALKTELFRKVEDLGPQRALFPSEEKSIDVIVQQLELVKAGIEYTYIESCEVQNRRFNNKLRD